jgi:6-phosphogluconolactonase (cycloisomerase 2 family)
MVPLSLSVKTTALLVLVGGLEAQSRFVYANNDVYPSNTVSGFSSDSNGVLTPIPGSPFATRGGGTSGGALGVDRITVAGGKFLYASNGDTQNISAFSVNPATGALTPVAGSPFSDGASSGFGDISLAASPNGKFLFAGLALNTSIVTFSIGTDGSLTELSSVGITDPPTGMKVSADGNYLAVSMPNLGIFGAVAVYSIGANGALTLINGAPLQSMGPAGSISDVDIDCAGIHLYAGTLTAAAATVDVFNIGSGGVLSPAPGSPFSAGPGSNSIVAILSPNDQFLFTTNTGTGSITVFSVTSGALSAIAGSPFGIAGVSVPAGMATDQGGTILYVAGAPNLLHTFSIGADGSLTEASGSPFSTNQTGGQLLSVASFPSKTCGAGTVGGPRPPPPPPTSATTVQIQIRSSDGDDDDDHGKPAEINPKSHGNIRVAILSTSSFNAPALVDMTSLTFGHSGTEKSLDYCETHRKDVDHDKLPDLVCHFKVSKMDFQKGDTEGILDGMLLDGVTPIQGKAPVKIAH